LNNQNGKLDAEICRLKDTCAAVKRETAEKSTIIQNLQDRVTVYEDKAKDQLKLCEQAQAQLITTTNMSEKKLKVAETQVAKLKTDNDKLSALVESQREALKTVQCEATKAADEAKRRNALELRQANEKSKSERLEIENIWKQKLTKSSEHLQNQARIQREKYALEKETATERINQLEASLLDRNDVISKITSSLQTAVLDKDKLNSQINSVKKEFQEMALKLESIEAERKSFEDRSSSLEQTEVDLQASIEQQEQKIIQLEKDKFKLLEANEAAKQHAMEVKLGYEDKIKSNAIDFEENLARIKRESRQDQERIKHELECTMTGLMEKHNQDMLSMKKQILVEERRCIDITHTKEELETQIDNIKRNTTDSLSSLNREVNLLKEQLEQKQQKCNSSESDCKNLEAEIDRLRKSLDESIDHREKLESKIKSFQEASASQIQELQQKHDADIAEIHGQIKHKVDAVKKEASDSLEIALNKASESERKRTKERESKHTEAFETIQQANNAKKEQITEMEQKLALIDDQVRTTRDALENSKKETISSNAKYSNAKKEIEKLRSQVSVYFTPLS